MTVGTNIRNLDGRVCIYLRVHARIHHGSASLHRAGARAHARCCTAIASSWNSGITFRHNRASALASAPRARQSPLLALFLLDLTIARILAAINVTAVKLTRNLRKRRGNRLVASCWPSGPDARDAHREIESRFRAFLGSTRLRDYAITRLRDYAILNVTSINERNESNYVRPARRESTRISPVHPDVSSDFARREGRFSFRKASRTS